MQTDFSAQDRCRDDFRHFLIDKMAKIDQMHLGRSYEYHYSELNQWTDFSLLQYWLTYNGVFDGGESELNELKRLIAYSPTCNRRSHIQNLNI